MYCNKCEKKRAALNCLCLCIVFILAANMTANASELPKSRKDPYASGSEAAEPSGEEEYADPSAGESEVEMWTENGNTYTGAKVNGLIQGWGTCSYSNGNFYVGEWSEGEINGFGRGVWSDGEIYEGEWLNGNVRGYGIDRSDSWSYFEIGGNYFPEDYRVQMGEDEYGPYIWAYRLVRDSDGSAIKDGVSFIYYSDGYYEITWYENGEERSDLLEEKSSSSTGNIYTGQFEEENSATGLLLCEGTSSSGGKVLNMGNFEDGNLNGSAIHVDSSGVFVGDFANGNTDGQGVAYYFDDGSWTIGSWSGLSPEGEAFIYTDGNYYRVQVEEGDIVNNEQLNMSSDITG